MELSPQGLPIIDLAPTTSKGSESSLTDLATHIADACESTGCFYIKNHGIDHSLINNFFRDQKTFFRQPLDYKLKYKVEGSLDRGYFPFETQNVNAFMGRPNLPNDPVEKLGFGPTFRSYPMAENIFPDIPPTLKETAEKYFLAFENLANTMLRVFALAVKAPDENYFYRNCHDGPHSLKGNFYPSYSKPKPNQDDRFAAHTDITAFTILATDDCPKALQVKDVKGEWIYADPVRGALFVNLGDVMQRWTNDRWKATEHKVVWPKGDHVPDRQSIVFFVLMNPDAIVECVPSCIREGSKAKYESITYRDFFEGPMRALRLEY